LISAQDQLVRGLSGSAHFNSDDDSGGVFFLAPFSDGAVLVGDEERELREKKETNPPWLPLSLYIAFIWSLLALAMIDCCG
jgi:hypothetical protein